jgi:hypothetical protein
VPQAREHAGPVVVVVMIIVVLVTVVVVVTVIQVRAVHGVHDIQNARINALPHIDKYQGRALANCPQYARTASPGLGSAKISRNGRSESYRGGSKPGG